MVPGAKEIKVFCADSADEMLSWYAGIRLAKHGHALYDNYYKAHVKQFKLEEAEKTDKDVATGLEQRAYTLTGMRLEKHLDKKREMYQKEKEAKEAQENMFRTGSFLKTDDQQQSSPSVPRVPPKPSPKPTKPTGEPKHYPPPTQPAPPTPATPPAVQDEQVSRFENLSHYPWYHGAIPRDEAVRRLEQMGGSDGYVHMMANKIIASY